MTTIVLNDEKIKMIQENFGLYYGEFPEFIYCLPEMHPYIQRRKVGHRISFCSVQYFEKDFIEYNELPDIHEFRKIFEEDSKFRSLFFPES